MTGPRGRAWVGVDHLRVFGPFDGNIADRLRAAQAPPGADAVTRFLIDTPLNGRPLLLATDGAFVGARISHALGDGRVVNTLLPALLGAAGDVPPPVRLPLLRALLHHFGRHPARLARAARVSRPPAAAGTAPWRPDVQYVSVRSGSALATIRAWRDRSAPDVSAASVLFAAAPAALARAGLPPKWPGAVVLVDCRRYLPDGARVAGNFSWGQYLVPDDATDPRAVQAALAAELESGRPLVMLALRTARLGLRLAQRAPVPGLSANPRPELTLTHIGRLDAYAGLPWAGPPEGYRNISVPTVSGPEALTLSFSELAGALYVNASFHGSTFDPARVAAAVDLLCADPVGLVSAGAG